jgi:hypothetical protein
MEAANRPKTVVAKKASAKPPSGAKPAAMPAGQYPPVTGSLGNAGRSSLTAQALKTAGAAGTPSPANSNASPLSTTSSFIGELQNGSGKAGFRRPSGSGPLGSGTESGSGNETKKGSSSLAGKPLPISAVSPGIVGGTPFNTILDGKKRKMSKRKLLIVENFLN